MTEDSIFIGQREEPRWMRALGMSNADGEASSHLITFTATSAMEIHPLCPRETRTDACGEEIVAFIPPTTNANQAANRRGNLSQSRGSNSTLRGRSSEQPNRVAIDLGQVYHDACPDKLIGLAWTAEMERGSHVMG
jgi:hypothetical protein